MATINLTVTGHDIVCTNEDEVILSQGSHNIDTVVFTYDSTYSGYTLYACMYQTVNNPVSVALDSNDSCTIPLDALLYPGKLRIGLRAENDDGTVIATSNLAWFYVEAGAIDGSEALAAGGSALVSSILSRLTALEAGSSTSGGLSSTEKSYILTLLEKSAYADSDSLTAYTALSELWGGYSITWNGTGYTAGNSATSVSEGESFTSTITINTGYVLSSVTVTMGGTTVAGAYSSGTVTIPSVTGDIVITVTTTALTVSSISAVYTQSGTVYDTASLSDLTSDLVVTATFSDSTTGVISSSDYTLSGTLSRGTSTITVSYGGCTDTFDVTVSGDPVLTMTGLNPKIAFSDISLTSGYIDNNGNISSLSNSYVYNELVPGNAFVILDSNDAMVTTTYRLGCYDSEQAFVKRTYTTSGASGISDSSASYIKMGYTGSLDSTNSFLNVSHNLSDICTIENTRIIDGGTESSVSGNYASDYIPIAVTGIGAISRMAGSNAALTTIAFYDANYNFISYFDAWPSATGNGYTINVFEITSEMKYCRISTNDLTGSMTSLIIEEV